MQAMVLKENCEIEIEGESRKLEHLPLKKDPLVRMELPDPVPGEGQILIKVSACGVCHTELDEIEGRLIPPHMPVVPGHEVVGRVASLGDGPHKFKEGDRVGVAWIYSSCKKCKFCLRGYENLCEKFQATGLDANGGYAQYMTISDDFAYAIPDSFTDFNAAPLLCAGVIGYRALRVSGINNGGVLGLYGFGASAHIVLQIAKHWGCKVFVFSRNVSGDHKSLAESLGADWVGATNDTPPQKLDCAIDFTPVGEPILQALKNLERGGRVVINAIRKIVPIPAIEYAKLLWHEKEIKSVANVTSQDASEFLLLADEIGIKPEVQLYEMYQVNEVLAKLKQAKIRGAAVIKIPD